MFMVAPVHDVVNDLVLITDWYVHIFLLSHLGFYYPRLCYASLFHLRGAAQYFDVSLLHYLPLSFSALLLAFIVFVVLSLVLELAAVLGSLFLIINIVPDNAVYGG